MEPSTAMDAASGIMSYLIYVGIIVLVLAVFFIICTWKIFTKAGKPGWACIIPIYSSIVMLDIIGKPWWHIFLTIIPIYGQIILPIKWTHQLSKVFGQGVGFTLGIIFLSFIFIPMLAFGGYTYTAPAKS